MTVAAGLLCYGGYKSTANKFKSKDEMELLSMNEESVTDIGTWKKIDRKFDSMRMCAICKRRDVEIQTHCWHFFHLKCMLEWTRVNDFCPICKDTLENHRHQFYCVDCGRREIDIHFKEMKKYSSQGRLGQEITCDKCRDELLEEQQEGKGEEEQTSRE